MERSLRAIVPDGTYPGPPTELKGSMEKLLRSARVELLDSCLVVEDDSIIRLDLEETLKGFGLKQVHGAPNLEAALQIIASADIRFAVLDYNVGPGTTVEMAEALAARGIPAVFLTAYGSAVELPQTLAHVQVLAKPFSSDLLAGAMLKELEKVLAPAAGGICDCGCGG